MLLADDSTLGGNMVTTSLLPVVGDVEFARPGKIEHHARDRRS